MFCCGKNRSTRFCPNCGKAMTQTPEESLLAHLREHATSYAARVVDYEPGGTLSHGSSPKERLRTNKELAEKWASWLHLVESLVVIRDRWHEHVQNEA